MAMSAGDELIRRRAQYVLRSALVGAGSAAALIFANWASLTALGNILLVLAADLLRIAGLAALVVAAIFMIINVVAVLRLLSERAIAHQPPLSRSATDIHTMHTWPVRNIPGPVVILAESGVVPAMGPGRYIWYLSCLHWPIGLVSFFVADLLKPTQLALMTILLAFVGTAVTAYLLRRILAPEELMRAIPAADSRRGIEPAFWSKGIIEPANAKNQAEQSARVHLPIDDDAIDSFYRKS